jgi:uncharacterized SAM-binding protein YcdF (DUF218 family)
MIIRVLNNNKSKGNAAVVVLVVIALCLIACLIYPAQTIGPVGHLLRLDEEPEAADAIIILLGGDSPNRVLKGYELFTKGFAPRIVLGSGFVHREAFSKTSEKVSWPTPSYPYQQALKSLGLPKTDLIIVNTSDAFDTAHELSGIAEYARTQNWQNVILVSSPTHTLRLTWIWQRIAPEIKSITVSAEEDGFDVWWEHGRLRRAVAYEAGALVKEAIAQCRHLLSQS